MYRSGRKLAAVMGLTGVFVYAVLWAWEIADRHWVEEGPGLDVRMTLSVPHSLGFLAVLVTLLIAVHVSLWQEGRRVELDERGARRVTHLDTFALVCGMGASGAAVATSATAIGEGVLTGGVLSVVFAAGLVVVLSADASLAVQRDTLEREGRRAARARRDDVRRIVDRLGADGPAVPVAIARLLGGVVASAAGGVIVTVFFRPSGTDLRAVDAAAPAGATMLLIVAVGALAAAWLDRWNWANVIVGGAALAFLLLLGFVAAVARARGVPDLVAGLVLGFVLPLVAATVSVARPAGSLRSLLATWFGHVLRQIEVGLDDTTST